MSAVEDVLIVVELRCESLASRLAPGSTHRRGRRRRARNARVVVWSGGGGRLADGDLEAERFDLVLQAPRAVLGRVALALPVRSEFTERHPAVGRCGSTRRGCRGGSRRSPWPHRGAREAVRDARPGRCPWCEPRPSRTPSAPRSASAARGVCVPSAGDRRTHGGRDTSPPRTRSARPSGTWSCQGRTRRS
jgi:hypothetical protein